LAAPGVAAHRIKNLSGFTAIYGPIRSADLGPYLDGGFKATPEMRRKTFDTWERTALVPVELVQALRTACIISPILFLLAGLGGPGGFWFNALVYGTFAVCALVSAIAAGAVVTPILLPWLPGRAFALKGIIPGLLAAAALLAARSHVWGSVPDRLETVAWLLLIPALATYLSMNFTGASTYTSLSGVKKEMRWALPFQIVAVASGLGLWLLARVSA
jgi:acetyl-CoA decarbonylase/synthase complex subunit gamma